MFSNTIRRMTAIILAILSVCMMLPAQAETITVDMLFGEVKNDTYENAFLGLGCTLEGWHYYSDDELEAVNQRTKAALSDDQAELIAQNISVLMAERPDGMQNINIQLQNVEDYVEIYNSLGLENVATESLSGFKHTIEQAGFADVEINVDELMIGDQSFTCVSGEYTMRGVQVYFKQLWVLRDNYLATATATTILEDTTDEVFSYFFLI